jgi:hypothetical protein
MLLLISSEAASNFSTLFSGVRVGKPGEEQTPYLCGTLRGNCTYNIYASDEGNC